VRAASATSAKQRLSARVVDAFVGVTTWPTSAKTAVLCGLTIPAVLVNGAVGLLFSRHLMSLEDGRLLVAPVAAMTAWCTTMLLVGLLVARAGRQGRWTAYLYVLGMIPLYSWVYALYGTASSPLAATYGLGILAVMMFFDSRIGWFSFFAATAIGLVVILVEIYGPFRYAPILLDRSIDAQRNGMWAAAVFTFVHSANLVALLIVQLMLSARGALQRQLARTSAELAESNHRLESATALISRYVPRQLASEIVSGSHDVRGRPERRRLTIVFSDIEGFTDAADRMEPEEFTDLLNRYLSEMTCIAEEHGGTLNQVIGDALMIFFGAPETGDERESALCAVRMALAMQRRMAELGRQWFAEGVEVPWRIRIGINTGSASVGDFGSAGRVTYSAIGNQTNLTARIQAHCEPGKVLISHATWALVRDAFPCLERGPIEVKGIHYAVRVYEVVDEAPDQVAPSPAS
jgi:class 3 adenylate cyclase